MKKPWLSEINRARATHGHTCNEKTSPTYKSWSAMMDRAHRGIGKDAARYFHRGIRVCKRWTSFVNFLADMGARPVGKTLDRIDGKKGYRPGNCRWATLVEQSKNKRKSAMVEVSAFGKTQCLRQWGRDSGIDRRVIGYRLKAGWPICAAVSVRPKIGRRGLKRRTGNNEWPRVFVSASLTTNMRQNYDT